MISFLSQDVINVCCYDYVLFTNIVLRSAEKLPAEEAEQRNPWRYLSFSMTVNDVSIYKHNNRVITHALILSSLLCIQCYSKQGRKPNFPSFHLDLNCICNKEIFTQSKCSFILVQQTSPFLFFYYYYFSFILGHSVLTQVKFSSGGDNSNTTQWTITRALNASPVACHSDLQKWE